LERNENLSFDSDSVHPYNMSGLASRFSVRR
jgi:hypothetical protein